MGTILTFIAYIVCIVFLVRLALHVSMWVKAARRPSFGPVAETRSASTLLKALLDVIFFRRLFKTNRLLWVASWTFHVSFLLMILIHLRYFLYPVPGFIVAIQSVSIVAGSVLTLSLFLIVIIRTAGNKDRYISLYNFFLLGVLLLTGLTGLLMKTLFRINLVDVKAFTMGIIALSPDMLPDSMLFTIHFMLVLLLIPYLPFHLITAPIITMEARRREEGLEMVLHEK